MEKLVATVNENSRQADNMKAMQIITNSLIGADVCSAECRLICFVLSRFSCSAAYKTDDARAALHQ